MFSVNLGVVKIKRKSPREIENNVYANIGETKESIMVFLKKAYKATTVKLDNKILGGVKRGPKWC